MTERASTPIMSTTIERFNNADLYIPPWFDHCITIHSERRDDDGDTV